ncbi:MAG: hypothetical protein KatS3mg005_0776 [Bryobacteraceae bacterium]|nr:MAG: hypothetical protein KatS3mg005_0776 [Bryobacteraceae bacterium]
MEARDLSKNRQASFAVTLLEAEKCRLNPQLTTSAAQVSQRGVAFITGSQFSPNGLVRLFVAAPGRPVQEIGPFPADSSGTFVWDFRPSCQDPIGVWGVEALDVPRHIASTALAQRVVRDASCQSETAPADSAELIVSDGPAGTLAAGAAFVQSWTLRNSGTTTWDASYRLEYLSGDMGCPRTPVALDRLVAPGQTFTFSLACRAPQVSGENSQSWQFYGPRGTIPIGQAQMLRASVTVSAPLKLIVSPMTLTFSYMEGQAASAPATLSIRSSGKPVPYDIRIESSSVNWLTIEKNSSSTPGSVVIGATAGMKRGMYEAKLQVLSPETEPVPIAIRLEVTAYTPPPRADKEEHDKTFLIGSVYPDRDTVVLTHGLQEPDQDVSTIWTGLGSQHAGFLIQRRLEATGRSVNILQFIWRQAFVGIFNYPSAWTAALPAGTSLAIRLLDSLCPEWRDSGCKYTGKVHFIGHSLGTVVNAIAVNEFLKRAPRVTLAQYTALDRPVRKNSFLPFLENTWFHNILIGPLQEGKLRIDNYYAKTGFGTGESWCAGGGGCGVIEKELSHPSLLGSNSAAYITTMLEHEMFFVPKPVFSETGNDHTGVHQWYRWTIWPYVPVESMPDEKTKVCDSSGAWRMPPGYVLDGSLNPCSGGFHESILLGKTETPLKMNFSTNAYRADSLVMVNSTLPIAPNYSECSVRSGTGGVSENVVGAISCKEQSSAYSAVTVDIPRNARAISFLVRVESQGDADTAVVSIDNTPIWTFESSLVPSGEEFESGPIPIGDMTGSRVLTVGLLGGGERNFAFELKDFKVLLAEESAATPVLTASVTRSGEFRQGQREAQFQILVSGSSSSPGIAGNVEVNLMLPSGMSLVSMQGSGWYCTGMHCVTTANSAVGSVLEPIRVTVDIAANATSPQVVLANVSGGGSAAVIVRETIAIQPAFGGNVPAGPPDMSPSGTAALPQLAFGGGWQTSLYFYNTTDSSVSFPVNFISQDGRPLSVPLDGGSPVSSRIVTLGPRASIRLLAPNTGELVQGWAETALPPGVGGHAVFRQSMPGRADQEAVVPLVPESSRYAHFAFDDERATTAIAVVNPSTQAASVRIVAYGSDNSLLGSADVNLGPRSKTVAVLRALSGLGGVNGRYGRVQVETSSSAVSVLGLRFSGEAFTSIPVFHSYEAVTTRFVLPQLVYGGGWTTEVYFVNTTSQPVQFPVSFFSDLGGPLMVPFRGMSQSQMQVLSLAPGATVRLVTMGGPVLFQGWAEANLPAGVIGHAVFRQSVVGRADQEAVVPLTKANGRFAEFSFDDIGLTTTMAVLNPTYVSALLTITSIADDGKVIGTSQVPLPPQAKRAYVIRDLVEHSGVIGRRGRIRLTVQSGEIAVLGFRFGGEAFTSIPVHHH